MAGKTFQSGTYVRLTIAALPQSDVPDGGQGAKTTCALDYESTAP